MLLKLERLFIACDGIFAIAIFILLLAMGGFFESLHTFLFRELSFVISPYFPDRDLTIPIYQSYNLLVLLFSLIVGLKIHNKYAKIGATYLLLSAIFGWLLLQFPMDPEGSGTTEAGILHNTTVLLISFYIIIALQLFAQAFKQIRGLTSLARFTFIISLIILVGGLLTGMFAAFSLPHFVGLIEKLPIVAFLAWLFWVSIIRLKR